ncbi:MAG TPA: carboxypeptidase-like regulatory domain-containing protein [Acidobacteriota bacterium]|nr:carboxypeptidase-like regulatory domain-containing protein [Acidobacteriota bacterium]
MRRLLLLTISVVLALLVFPAAFAAYGDLCSPSLNYTEYPWNYSEPYFYDYDADNLTDAVCADGPYSGPTTIEDLGITSKPYPNVCTPGYHGICSENTVFYSRDNTYDERFTSFSFCLHDGSSWSWTTLPGGLADIQGDTEICSGGLSSLDNNCNALEFYQHSRNGAANYSRYNYTGVLYFVYPDVDAFDPDCSANLSGYVKNSLGYGVNGVTVTLLLVSSTGENSFRNTTTDATGYYEFTVLPASTYKIFASKTSFNSEILALNLSYVSNNQLNMTLTTGVCQNDCTTTAQPTICSAACDGFNGCAFYNTTMATALDGKISGYDYLVSIAGIEYTVSACEGTPAPYVTSSTSTGQIQCPSGTTLVVIERVALQDGEPVKIIIPVCRSS